MENQIIILLGTGSELQLCVSAAKELKDKKVRVVSFPSWELFKEQSLDYQQSVFLPGVPVLAVEAGSVIGWREYSHAVVGMNSFWANGHVKDVFKHFVSPLKMLLKEQKKF